MCFCLTLSQIGGFAEQWNLTEDTHFRSPPALVPRTANAYEDGTVPDDLGLLNIPVRDLDSGARSTNVKTAGP